MSRLLLAPSLLLGALAAGCVSCNDCDEPAIRYRYLNKSSHAVVLAVLNAAGDTVDPSGSIPKGDSAEFVGKDGGFLGARDFHASPSAHAVIAFSSQPERCLVFSGAIADSLEDLRSPRAYNQDSPFIYTIDDTDFGKATACP